jgi:putative ABC transport system permease protein
MPNLTLALRNIVRHRTRSAIALSAIAFSIVALVLAGGFVDWIFWATREAAIQNGLGHIHVVRPGYLDAGAADPRTFLLPDRSPEFSALEATPEVMAVTPRLHFSGLISFGEATLSFLGEGVDPETDKLISRVLQISRGEGLTGADPLGIILGHGLASNLGVAPGDKVVLLAATMSGGINAVETHVRGTFVTEARSYDNTALRVPTSLARALLRVSGSHVWVVGLDRTEHTQAVVDHFRSRFKADELQFVPWFELSDFYDKVVALLSRQMNVVRLMIALITLLSICNMLIMNVLERTGEIGTLMAMGTRRVQILTLFVTEGLFLGLAGGVLGMVTGIALAHLVSAIGIPMPPPPGGSAGYSAKILLTWQLVAGAFGLGVVTTVLASLYPAWKASRFPIVDALRHNR